MADTISKSVLDRFIGEIINIDIESNASLFRASSPISTFAPLESSKTPTSSAITLKLSSSTTTGSGDGSGGCGTTGFPPPHPIIVVNKHITRNNEIIFFHIIKTSFLFLFKFIYKKIMHINN